MNDEKKTLEKQIEKLIKTKANFERNWRNTKIKSKRLFPLSWEGVKQY
jgi:hypothetical protein